MQVTLVRPTTFLNSNTHPLNIGYIYASLEHEKYLQVSFVDGEKIGLKYIKNKDYVNESPGHTMWKEISREIMETNPDLIAFSCYSLSMTATKYIIDILRENDFSGHIWVGGIHPTNCPPETLENIPGLDGVVIGEGELTIQELCRTIHNSTGRDLDLSGVKGIAYRKGRQIKVNQCRSLIEDMDKLPIPSRTFAGKYSYSDHIILTSRGCPFTCDFCDSKTIWGRRVRFRTAGHVLGEIESVAKLGIKSIGLRDDTFTLNTKHVEDICRSIKERKLDTLDYIVGSRIDTMNEHKLSLLQEMNVKLVTFGVETGSPVVQKKIKKNLDLSKVVPTVLKTNNAGIHTITFFMLGHPEETVEDLEYTLSLIRELAKHCRLNQIDVNITCPYPGTGYWDYAIKTHGKFIDFYSESYKYYHQAKPFVNLTNIEDNEFYWHVNRIMRITKSLNKRNYLPLVLHKYYKSIKKRTGLVFNLDKRFKNVG